MDNITLMHWFKGYDELTFIMSPRNGAKYNVPIDLKQPITGHACDRVLIHAWNGI